MQNTKNEDYQKDFLSIKCELLTLQSNISKKVNLTELDGFEKRLEALPQRSELISVQQETAQSIQQCHTQILTACDKMEEIRAIVQRYDEVLCEKAQKHQFLKLETLHQRLLAQHLSHVKQVSNEVQDLT